MARRGEGEVESETEQKREKEKEPVKESPPSRSRQWYHRSDHLDSLVWMVLSAASEEVRQQFRQREEVAARELKEVFNIDVSQGYSFAEGAMQELPGGHQRGSEKGSARSSSSGNRNHRNQRNNRKRGKGSEVSMDVEDEEEEERLCEYCGGGAHEEGERCPHKANSTSSEEQEDEEEEEEDF